MSDNEILPLPDNPGCYEELKDGNCYFVDKTEFIKTVFTSSTKVLLFTRPRRFGKTLLMTMFESFLKINSEKPFDTSLQQKYFQGTRILEDKEFCSKFMGQYPVISISLKNVDGLSLVFNACRFLQHSSNSSWSHSPFAQLYSSIISSFSDTNFSFSWSYVFI